MPYSPTTRWRGTLNRAPITFTTAIPAVRSSAPYKKLWRFPAPVHGPVLFPHIHHPPAFLRTPYLCETAGGA